MQSRNRIAAIDAARALAVIGMVIVNVGPRSGDGLADVLHRIPLGRASLLFVLLAGLGISLLTRRARDSGGPLPWASLLWRSGLLLVGGLALQLLDHGVSVILPTYALLFLIALPVVRAPDRLLLVLAGALMVLGPVTWIFLQMVQGVRFASEPASLTDSPLLILHKVLLSSPYPVITWAGPFLLGMWLGRRRLSDRVLQRRMIVTGAIAAVAGRMISLALVAWLGEPSNTIGFDRLVTSVAHSQMPLWLLSGTGSALLALGVLLRLGRVVDRWLWPLVATGQLALTIYVAHLFALALLIRPEPHTLAEGVLISFVLSVLAIVGATLWRRYFKQGPFEALLRDPWNHPRIPTRLRTAPDAETTPPSHPPRNSTSPRTRSKEEPIQPASATPLTGLKIGPRPHLLTGPSGRQPAQMPVPHPPRVTDFPAGAGQG
ncbi:DUF418 domain-containing protein [Georgenia daeguensis]|uniref:Heparan-alpha-glucosaminide N-acetyltransferase domain-containing protein n=1 Tax=Georgenia daeguensis TaxID=908355 RepID=A0ABP8EYR3_9MICO